MTLDMLPVMHIFNNHNKLKSQPQSEYKTGCVGQTWIQPEQWWREDGSGQGAGQPAVTTKEMITCGGAVVGSSYIAEGVSPVARRVDVTGCRRPVSLHRRGVGDDGGLARVARAHPHSSH